jgi:long-chain acyl-CoA synthetase
VKTVIYWGDSPGEDVLKAVAGLGIQVTSWADALVAGAAKPAAPVPPTADDYCTIMYTSGTTGGWRTGDG